jgi:putative peptidoglycan lipid II flippase
MVADEKNKVTRAASVVGFATLLSRIGGFVRDMVIAYFFGAGPVADAFFVAFRIPNLLRRFFAEGTLTIAFIPVFTEVLKNKGKQEAEHLFRSAAGLLGLVLLGITLLGIIFAEQVVRAMAPGFATDSGTYALAVSLTRWCMPFILFISLAALAGGVLNSLEHFFAPALAPALSNLCLIFSAIAISPLVDPPVLALAIGVLLGGAVHLGFQLPFLRSRGMNFIPAWDVQNPQVRRIVKLMGPAAFGAAVYQLTVLMNTMLASMLPTGSVSFLYFADRLIHFPLGIFGIALATAVLPSLSRQAAEKNLGAMADTMIYGLRLTMFIILPAMVGLMVLARPLVDLLYLRGEFQPEDAQATAMAVTAYAGGLWAFAATRNVVQAYYALQDTKTPVKVAAVSLVINLTASLGLMMLFDHVGLAMATSISGTFNLLALLWLLHKRLGGLGVRSMLYSCIRMLLASMLMGAVVAWVGYAGFWDGLGPIMRQYARPLAAVVLGGVIYLAAAYALRVKELKELIRAFGRR